MRNKIRGQHIKWVMLVLTLSMVAGCSIPKPKPDLTNPIRTVAILPFANDSNNIDAPKQIRDQLKVKLGAKFYKVIPIEEIDQTMVDELGITLGGQLSEVSFEEIKSKINADAFLYGQITHYDQTTTGVLNTNRVRAILKMVQVRDESVFWESAIGIKSESKSGDLLGSMASLASAISDNTGEDPIQWVTIERKTGGDGSIFGNLVAGLVEKAMSNALGVNLTQETVAFVNRNTSTLRNGPGF